MSIRKKVSFLISISIFIVLLILLLTNNISFFDNFIYSIIIYFKNNLHTKIYKVFTFSCSVKFIIGFTILLVILIRNNKIKLFILCNLCGVVLLNQVLKRIIRRPRPSGISLIKENGFSFPSGHSMVSMAFYGLFIYLIYKSKLNRETKLLLSLILSLLILFIGISRIYLGVHYASDVVAGFSLSIAYLIISIYIYEKKTGD